MSDTKLKSAYELAMERLRKKDAEAGIEQRELTSEQKTAIAELRSFYEAKLAQEDIMHRSALARTLDPLERERLVEEHGRERDRLVSEREAKIARVRSEQRSS